MTKEQIEQKAKEIANKYAALGFKCSYSHELYEAAMKMADFILSHQWVSVEDELPPHSESESNFVLTRTSIGYFIIGCFDYKTNFWRDENWNMIDYDITHWMPIPPVAEKGGRDE